jgi:hypothetical protein
MGDFIGDEPKSSWGVGANRAYYPKIHSDMIKVLPKWENYELASRSKFKKRLLAMLKQVRGTFLLRNEQHEIPVPRSGAGGRKGQVLNTPFTPGPVRHPPTPGSGSGRPTDDISQVLWRSSTHTPAHVMSSHAVHDAYGLEHATQGYSQQPAHVVGADSSIAYGHAEADSFAYGYSAQMPFTPMVGPPWEQNWDLLGIPPIAPGFQLASTPSSLSSSIHSARSGLYSGLPVSHVDTQSVKSDASAGSGGGGSAKSGRSCHSGLSTSSLARHDLQHLAADMRKGYNEAALAQNKHINEMLSGQAREKEDRAREATMHRNEAAMLRLELAAVKAQRTEYTEAADGLEDWVINDMLEEDLRETHRWWHVEERRYENEHETSLRSRVYQHLTTQLPKELYSQKMTTAM